MGCSLIVHLDLRAPNCWSSAAGRGRRARETAGQIPLILGPRGQRAEPGPLQRVLARPDGP